MKKLICTLILALTVIFGTVIPTNAQVKSYVDAKFVDIQTNKHITPYVEKEKNYNDGFFKKRGTASFTFKVDSGHTKLNAYFKNDSNVGVSLTLYERSGYGGNWNQVSYAAIAANSNGYVQITPDKTVTYKVEVSNSTGDLILGKLRVRSFN